jgi:carbon storage regulator
MLVLTRKEGQSLVIDGSIVVRVLEIRGNSLRIGVEASEEVLVVRSELICSPPERSAIAGTD